MSCADCRRRGEGEAVSEALKPCPCCGSDANRVDRTLKGIECTQCDLCMPSYDLMAGSYEQRWNRRANERTALQEAVLRAAVAMARTDMGSDAIEYRIDDVCDAVDALLAAEPDWGDT